MNDDLSSDASDDDYVPEGVDVVLPSEEESDGEVEDDLIPQDSRKRGKTKSKKTSRNSKKLRRTEDLDSEPEEEPAEVKPVTQEEEKKKADSLWADFLKDTDTKPKVLPKPQQSAATTSKKSEKPVPEKPIAEKKVTVTQVFEFAGEEVKITKEVPVDSLEARSRAPRGRGGAGLSSVLNQLGKKQKISTLEKTKLDWDRFKKDENIAEELEAHNKGKHGYLERQDFLQRADLRQFEIEKDIRSTHRSSRV